MDPAGWNRKENFWNLKYLQLKQKGLGMWEELINLCPIWDETTQTEVQVKRNVNYWKTTFLKNLSLLKYQFKWYYKSS